MNTFLRLFSWTTLLCCAACSKADDSTAKPAATPKTVVSQSNEPLVKPAPKAGVITFGGGCFWCVEAVYQRIEGITKVTSGYMGGKVPNPTYKQICTGRTGHAEVVKVEFDPEKIPLEKVLAVFWRRTIRPRSTGRAWTSVRNIARRFFSTPTPTRRRPRNQEKRPADRASFAARS